MTCANYPDEDSALTSLLPGSFSLPRLLEELSLMSFMVSVQLLLEQPP